MMRPFSVSDIRRSFLDFFASKGHTVVPSASLVPGNDPTLLFTNSGMVQFKDVFLGTDKRGYVRAASVQACLRAGGKHNDLENVGYTARHHTFFEMLGNWSFGDYFKRESLMWAWELLTQVYGLPADRLWATVYAEDDEAYEIWTREIGLPPERVIRIGDNKGGRYMSDNFWMMAETGPCGPCSEIFYDHGPQVAGGPPGSEQADGDRFIEIWNNVFMQFEMHEDGSLTALPAPCVDTGMGLERLAAVLQGVHSNYEIDLFAGLIEAAARQTGCEDLGSASLRVIADHLRAAAFLVVDGVLPGNEGRGYVQRRIVRRAVRHGYKLGCKGPFLHALVPDLVALMGPAYGGLVVHAQRIAQVLRDEEERFFETLGRGMEMLEAGIGFARCWTFLPRSESGQRPLDVVVETGEHFGAYSSLSSEGRRSLVRVFYDEERRHGRAQSGPSVRMPVDEEDWGSALKAQGELGAWVQAVLAHVQAHQPDGVVLSGEVAFKLHDTFGFPLDLTQDVCRERGVGVDVAGFEAAMEGQRARARAAGRFKMDKAHDYAGAPTLFVGYEQLSAQAKVLALYVQGVAVEQLEPGCAAEVVLDVTPFYAQSGGQVGDVGVIESPQACFEVRDTRKIRPDVFVHDGVLLGQGVLRLGDVVQAAVNAPVRAAAARHHSATHLLHQALREVLGEHVQQKGSLVDGQRTRFDFAHHAPLTRAQIEAVEARVNAQVLRNTATGVRLMDVESARQTGAAMLFGEKYGEVVRVLDIGNSCELCGGTHVRATGDIGLFKVVSESGVAAGVRRVEALAGEAALGYVQGLEQSMWQAAGALKAAPGEVNARLTQVLAQLKAQEKTLAALETQVAQARGAALLTQAVDVGGVRCLVAKVEAADAKALRQSVHDLKARLGSGVVLLAMVEGERVQVAAGVSADVLGRVPAGDLVGFVAQKIGGKGGGKPDMAMAGGSDVQGLDAALALVPGWVAQHL